MSTDLIFISDDRVITQLAFVFCFFPSYIFLHLTERWDDFSYAAVCEIPWQALTDSNALLQRQPTLTAWAPPDRSLPSTPLDLLWTSSGPPLNPPPVGSKPGGGECQGIGRNGTVNPSCQAITKLISWYFLLIGLVCLFLSFFSLFFLPFILRNAQLHNLRAKRCISPSSTVCLHHIPWWKKAQHKCPDWAERGGHGGRREAALLWPCIFHTPFLCRLRLNCGSLCVFRCHSRPRMPEWFQNQVKVIRQEWPHRNNISHSHLHLLNWQCLSLCLRVFVLAAVHDPPPPPNLKCTSAIVAPGSSFTISAAAERNVSEGL